VFSPKKNDGIGAQAANRGGHACGWGGPEGGGNEVERSGAEPGGMWWVGGVVVGGGGCAHPGKATERITNKIPLRRGWPTENA